MPTLLQIDSSPLSTSISRELTREYVSTWQSAHPQGTVIVRDLAALAPKHLDAGWIHAAYTPEPSRTPEQTATLALSDEMIGELERADEYVIGVAMHNFSIPSVLKLWIDQVVRRGRTFNYGSNGPEGLLKGKKATVIIASGGSYGEGSPAEAMNFVDPYLKTILRFIGVSDARFITADGASKLMSGSIDRTTFLKPTLERVRELAA
jgi:FMN-dependent NADH-azoreductase